MKYFVYISVFMLPLLVLTGCGVASEVSLYDDLYDNKNGGNFRFSENYDPYDETSYERFKEHEKEIIEGDYYDPNYLDNTSSVNNPCGAYNYGSMLNPSWQNCGFYSGYGNVMPSSYFNNGWYNPYYGNGWGMNPYPYNAWGNPYGGWGMGSGFGWNNPYNSWGYGMGSWGGMNSMYGWGSYYGYGATPYYGWGGSSGNESGSMEGHYYNQNNHYAGPRGKSSSPSRNSNRDAVVMKTKSGVNNPALNYRSARPTLYSTNEGNKKETVQNTRSVAINSLDQNRGTSHLTRSTSFGQQRMNNDNNMSIDRSGTMNNRNTISSRGTDMQRYRATNRNNTVTRGNVDKYSTSGSSVYSRSLNNYDGSSINRSATQSRSTSSGNYLRGSESTRPTRTSSFEQNRSSGTGSYNSSGSPSRSSSFGSGSSSRGSSFSGTSKSSGGSISRGGR